MNECTAILPLTLAITHAKRVDLRVVDTYEAALAERIHSFIH